MIWIVRLSGVLAVMYLIYAVTFLPGSQARAWVGPAMALTASGELVPVMDAVRINHLQAYEGRYPEYPAVLKESRWVSALGDQKTCAENPKKIWSFTEDAKVGRVCKPLSLNEPAAYECSVTGAFGKTSQQVFKVRFGDTILPDWALERPHITLTRGGWPKKTIGLQMCESSSS